LDFGTSNLFNQEIPLRLDLDSSGLIVSSDNIIFLFDNSQNKIDEIPILGDQMLDLAIINRNQIYTLAKNQNIYEINYFQKIGSNENLSNNIDPSNNIPFNQLIKEESKLILDSSQNLFISDPSSGAVYGIFLNTEPKSYYQIKNYSNNSKLTKTKLFVSDDSEKVFALDTNLKHINLLSRNRNNEFYFERSIIPKSDVQKIMRLEDKILDVKFHDQNQNILVGIQRNQKSFVLLVDFDFQLKSYWLNPSSFDSSLFGYSIDIHRDGIYAVISDPTYPAKDKNGTGILYLLDLNDKNLISIKSTGPIGNKVKYSDYNNEILSIGTKEGKQKLSWFSNIFSDTVRCIVLDENISDADFFLDSQMILTNNVFSNVKNKNEFYRNYKVNGCFEIMTKQAIEIPSLNQQGNISMVRLGNHHQFYYHQETSTFYLMDVRNNKIIVEWNDSFDSEKSNFNVSRNGNALAYAQINDNGIVYTICS
jgi:hypothetical protein